MTDLQAAVRRTLPRGRKVLLIVPDNTRTAPIGAVYRAIVEHVGPVDVIFALGTHPPMSTEAMLRRLEIEEPPPSTKLINHAWDDPTRLLNLGKIDADEIDAISGGRFRMAVDVTINRAILDYDLLAIVGPVFPHEVVGFSGGNKYLFPGIGGPELLHFFHWLGAVITCPKVIGHKDTPVRRVIDRAARMVPTERVAFCIAGGKVFAGTPEDAWSRAADESARQIVTLDRPYERVVACAPEMYDEIWVGGKCMYKLEPVVADGGELVIYGPHIERFSATHEDAIRRIGYHTRDYFLAQWDRFKHVPWGILAHSTHVRGIGTYEDGIESPRIKVTLATGISHELCESVGLGYLDPSQVVLRSDEKTLVVPNAGETLFRLADPPGWAS
ncbi:MAG TPA: lactate racemase domain-containing protein [Fimbriimonas sp.]